MERLKTATLPNGTTVSSSLRLPFVVRRDGVKGYYGSLDAARAAAPGGASIFFDETRGYGRFLEHT